jgi:hypothetical protein
LEAALSLPAGTLRPAAPEVRQRKQRAHKSQQDIPARLKMLVFVPVLVDCEAMANASAR